MGKLRLLSWNANGLAAKRLELAQLLQELNIDVALVQETHLRPMDFLNLPNYQGYRTDRPPLRPRASGGTAIFVHRRITHRLVNNPPTPGIEMTTIAVHYGGEELLLSSCYRPPNSAFQPQLLDAILQPNAPSLLAGDLNGKHQEWGCRATNAFGRRLKAYIDARPHIRLLAPADPTHYHLVNHLPDILDIGLAGSLGRNITTFAVSDLSSDHLPVVFDLAEDGAPLYPPRRTRKVNWVKFANLLANQQRPPPPPAENTDQLDDQVQDLTNLLQNTMTASSIPSPPSDRTPPLPTDLRDEIRHRRRLRRAYQRSRCPHAKADFNRQARRCARLLAEHRAATWDVFVECQAENDGGIWRVAKALRGEKKKIQPLQGQNGLVYSPEGRAEAFADTMEAQFSPHADVRDDDHCETVANFLDAYQPEDEEDVQQPFVTTREVQDQIRGLRRKKAPGPDSLGTPAFQHLPTWVIVIITCIFNSCLRMSYFPTTWKTAKVITIPKPGKDHLNPENHRPISLLPVLSKMFERVILARFPEEFFTSIRTEQFGFRKGHSTTLQLRRVINHLTGALQKKEHAASVLIDVSKAFDRVWHEGLLYKLASSPLPARMWKILRSYLHGRNFYISVGQATSTTRPVSSGVPQGSVLGPILYLWYTNDMPVAPRIQLSLYADDALLTATSINLRMARVYLQRQLDTLHPWLVKWRIKVNAEKCDAIYFTRTRTQGDGHHLSIDGRAIPWKSTIKYLGVLLDQKLTLTPHVDRLLSLAKGGLASLAPLFRSSKLPTRTKLLLYTALLRPVITYAAPAWYHLASSTSRKKLLAVQSKTLRRATNSPWFVRNSVIRSSSNISTVRQFVDGLTARLDETAEKTTWEHIRQLLGQEVPQLRPQILD